MRLSYYRNFLTIDWRAFPWWAKLGVAGFAGSISVRIAALLPPSYDLPLFLIGMAFACLPTAYISFRRLSDMTKTSSDG